MSVSISCPIAPSGTDGIHVKTEQLVSRLLNQGLAERDMIELEELLRSDATARETYVMCLSLHADLTEYFSMPRQ